MRTIAIIPARYASTRLPGKPLLDRTGKPLIQHVVERVARAARIDEIYVATDNDRIAIAVEAFGGRVVMTGECRTGTDRLAEAAARLGLDDEDVVVNVQGDEPDIPPACVDALPGALLGSDAAISTLATPISADRADDPNRVKVVCDCYGRALYFSRAKIPFDRDGDAAGRYLQHLGAYCYRAGFLRRFAAMASTPAEESEKLEQLRALEQGHGILVVEVDYDGRGIDTPADYEEFVRRQC